MCGRFFIAEEDEDELLSQMIEEASRRQQAIVGERTVARGEILPTATVAALARGKAGGVGAFPMQWGFHRADGKGLIINTRSETALDKPMFRQSILHRRCLIPASWYFEWETRDGQQTLLEEPPSIQIWGDAFPGGKTKNALKIKYAIRPKSAGLMYLAGIYRYEEARKLPVFSILTREPAREIAFIHDRMPVIFSAKHRDAWLDGAADPLETMKSCERDMKFQTA